MKFVFKEQLFSHVRTDPPLPGYYQYFCKVNVSCSRTKHEFPSEDYRDQPWSSSITTIVWR